MSPTCLPKYAPQIPSSRFSAQSETPIWPRAEVINFEAGKLTWDSKEYLKLITNIIVCAKRETEITVGKGSKKKWFERYNFVAIISGFLIFCKKNDRTRFFRDKLPDNSVHCKCPRSHNYIIIINITKQILIHLSWSPSSPLLRGGWGRSKWSKQRQVLYRVKPSEQKNTMKVLLKCKQLADARCQMLDERASPKTQYIFLLTLAGRGPHNLVSKDCTT